MTDLYLVLDIDHTLLCSYTSPLADKPYDFTFESYYFYLRPLVVDFLKEVQRHFKIIVWSAAGKDYVNAVVKNLFIGNNIFPYLVLTSEDCQYATNHNYQIHKPLTVVTNYINCSIDQILIVDNIAFNFHEDEDNGIHIPDYYGGNNDIVLKYLLRHLLNLKGYGRFFKYAMSKNWYDNELSKDLVFLPPDETFETLLKHCV